jgi:oligopeptide transport system substrate-binding protein
MNRSIPSFLLYLAILLNLFACTHPNDSDLASEQLLRRGNIEDPATLDPALAEDVHTFNVLLDLYEGLVAENARGELVPGVAESWSISDDGLLYTFVLRKTARWSNGEPVISSDFVRALGRAAAPETLAAYSFLLDPIEDVVAVDAATLTVLLAKPSPHFLGVLAMPIAFPIYGDGADATRFHEPGSFVGNGAYVLATRAAGRPIRLRRNTHYWDAASVQIAEIEYVPIADEVAELNMYRAGELDITGVIPSSHVQIVKRDLPDETRIAPSLAFYYFAFDLTEAPLDNRELRQALSMAIDREQLVALLGRGEQAAYGIVPPGVANHQGARYSWQDMAADDRADKAREVFERAGYGPNEPLQLKVTYDVGGVHEQIALAVSAMWHDVLGIEVVLEKKEWKYFLDTRENREQWQVMRFSWFGDYNDAATFTDIFHSASSQNLPHYSSAEYDEKTGQAASELNPETRATMMSEAEEILLDDYPVAPLYFYVSKHMVKRYVTGFEDNVLDRHPSKYLALEANVID